MTAELRAGDWRDTLPGTFDPDRAVVVTDPPYGLGGASRGYGDDTPWAAHVTAVLAELPAYRHVIRGPATTILGRDYPPARRLCIELATMRPRATYRPNTVAHTWQGWLIWGRLKVGRRPTSEVRDSLILHPYGDRESRGHHHAVTPYQAALWAVRTWTEPGDLVVDPFAGIGTIGRAAAELGRDYLGAEMDARWAAEAATRLASRQLRWEALG